MIPSMGIILFTNRYNSGKICGTLIGQTLKLRWSFQIQDLLDITHLADKLDYVRRGGPVGRKFPANSLKLMQKLSGMDAMAIMKR